LSAPTPPAPRRLGELARRERLILIGIVLAGALVRVVHHWQRPLTGDEVGTLLFLREDFGVLLGEFRSWLTMNYYLAGLKLVALAFGTAPWVLALPSLLAGVALILLIAAVVLRLSSARHALLAAGLAAANPFLAFYSTQVRAYMPFALLATLALLVFLDWQARPGWRAGWKVALASLAAILVHPNGVYPVVGLGVLLAKRRRLDRPASWSAAARRELLTLGLPMAAAALVSTLAYLPLRADMVAFQALWSQPPPTNVAYLPHLFENYFGGGYASLISALILGAGVWRAARAAPELLELVLLVVVPMVLVALVGVSHYPWAFARFLIPILPILLVFLAYACAEAGPRARWALFGVLLVAWTPAHARWLALKETHPWNEIAAHLAAEVGAEDNVYAIDPSIQVELSGHERGYEGRFVDARALAALAPEPSGARRVLVLLEAPFVEGVPSRVFGEVQVAEFEGADGRALATAVATALARAADNQSEARLVGHYRELFELSSALGRELDAAGSLAKFHKCQGIAYRERMRTVHMP
jgi:hypothetical protein